MEETKRESEDNIKNNNNSNSNSNSNIISEEKKQEKIKNEKKAKSCKGCLYYSSNMRSNTKNPLCIGISRSLPQVPHHIVGEAEVEASREGRSITDFKYGCIGYAVYSHGKDLPADSQRSTELPACVGLEILIDKRPNAHDSVPAHSHNKEGTHAYPNSRTQRPAHPVGEEFLSRFSRNATVVANGVVKNMRKAGNHIKDRVDDILYPYRRRPK